MELAQLLYFREVVLEKNISRAACKLYISQSALSRAIARLEQDIGADLVERHGNKIVITDAGKRFAERIDRALREIDLGIMEARRISNEHVPIASIAYTTLSAVDMLREFLNNREHAKVTTALASNEDVRKMVLKREADFGIVWGEMAGSHLICQTVMRGKLFALIHRENPLSQRSEVSLHDLRDERVICGRIGLTKDVVSQFFEAEGIPAHISDILAGQDRDMFADIAKDNIGICFVVLLEDLDNRLGALENIRCVLVKDVPEVKLCMIRRDDAYFTEDMQQLYDYAAAFFQRNEESAQREQGITI